MKCKDCNNFGCSYRKSFEKCFYQDDYLDEDFDWQSFRAEAAKDILCAMIQGGYGQDRIEHQSVLAVKYADELITQLKEKEEK